MIHCAVFFGTKDGSFKGSASMQCDDFKDVEEWAKSYFEHLQVSSFYLSIKVERAVNMVNLSCKLTTIQQKDTLCML